jgi:hypothetical protein
MLMKKRFISIVGLALFAVTVLLSGCELTDKGKDDSSSLLLMLIPDMGSVTFTVDATEYMLPSTGFGDPGDGGYVQTGAEHGSLRSLWIRITNTAPGVKADDDFDVFYYDDAGGQYTSDPSFQLTITSWDGKGTYATGTFSGPMTLFGPPGSKTITGGSFNVRINN